MPTPMAEVVHTYYRPAEAELARIDGAFVYHPPQDDQGVRYNELRSEALNLAHRMAALCPYSRELSLALSSLEQSIMWANAAIARHEPNLLAHDARLEALDDR